MPWGEGSMATGRDERLRQQRELEEIRRSFAEMGARMGSMFEPAEADEAERAPKRRPPPAGGAGGDRPPLPRDGPPHGPHFRAGGPRRGGAVAEAPAAAGATGGR